MNLNILIRQIRRSGFSSAVKFLSLLTGLSISVVILVWVRQELSYDDFWENKDRIYRVALEQHHENELQFRMAANYRGVTDLMLEEFPQVEGRVRLHPDRITVFTPYAQVQDVAMFYTDTCVFDILKREIVARESSQLFPDLRSVVISESLSAKIFGGKDPIGQSLKLNEGWQFYVSAVFRDVPENSHISFDLLMTVPSMRYYVSNFNNLTGVLDETRPFEYREPGPYDRGAWGRFYGYSYILVKKDTDIGRLKSDTESLIKPEKLPSSFRDTRINLIFQPVSDIHLHSALTEEIKTNGSTFKVYTLLLVAVIVLIISIVNFVNLSVIGFYDQSVNHAIRMIHGASVTDLLRSVFLKEMIITAAAGLASFLTGYFALRILLPGLTPGIWSAVLIIAVVILTALFTTFIPLWHFRSNSIQDMLRKKITTGRGGQVTRQVLVGIQFAISLFLIAGTIVIYFQLRFIQKKDPGFNATSVIYSFSPMTMNQRPDIPEKLFAFRSRMAGIPGIQNFCTSSSVPGKEFLMHSENVSRTTDEPVKKIYFQMLNADYAFTETYRLNFISGRNFIDTDQFPGTEVIINELAAEKLGFGDPADATGEMIRVDGRNYMICGVVNNFHHLSLKQQITPLIIFKSLTWRYAVGYYSFRISEGMVGEVIPLIGKAWEEIYPGERFQYKFLEDSYLEQYTAEKNFGRSLSLGSFLAILISCLGLFGYARYAAVKRIREIGIRKTFGATRNDIIILYHSEILRIITAAALFSLPLAWLLVTRWLRNFAYHVNVSAWMFLLALGLTILIAFSATFYISWRSSGQNPARSLKYE